MELSWVDLRNCATTLFGVFEFGITVAEVLGRLPQPQFLELIETWLKAEALIPIQNILIDSSV